MKKAFLPLLALFFEIPSHAASPSLGMKGIEYFSKNWRHAQIYIVRVDPQKNKISIGISENFERPETTSEIAKRNHADLAINGGFFNFGGPGFVKTYAYSSSAISPKTSPRYAFPDSLLKVKSKIISDSLNMVSVLAWNEINPREEIGYLKLRWTFNIDEKSIMPLVLVHRGSLEEKKRACPRIFGKDRTIVRILDASENQVKISDGLDEYFVDPEFGQELEKLQVGMKFKIRFDFLDSENSLRWNDKDYVLAANPILVKDGRIPHVLDTSLSTVARRRRSGICISYEHKWNFVLAHTPLSMNEFAEFMKIFQCEQAINLDGGPSSTLFFAGQVIAPSAERQRVVSDAILVKSLAE